MEENKVVGYSWIVFAIVLLAQSVALGLGMNCIPPFLTSIQKEMNLTSTQVGMAWGMIGLGALVFSVIGGLISDRIGARWTGFLGLMLMAFGGTLRGLAHGYGQFLASMLLFGIAIGLTRPNLPRALSQWFPSNRLGTVNGLATGGGALGAALSMALSVSHFGPLAGGWRNLVIVLGMVSFLLAISWVVLVRERISGERSMPDASKVIKGFGLVLHSRPVWILSIAAFLLFGHAGAWMSHFPGFFEYKHGMSSASAGQMVSITLFAGIFAAIIGPTLSDRLGSRKPAMLWACIAGGLCNLIQGSFLGPILIAVLVIMPFGVGTISPLMMTIPFELKGLPRSAAGAAIGMIFAFQNIGAFAYPIFSGWLIDLFTPNYYPFFGAQMMAFAVTFLLIWRLLPETGHMRRNPAPAP